MVAPAAAVVAAGWTVEEIAAATAIAGSVGGGVKEASASGDSGWNFDGPDGKIRYPAEHPDTLWIGETNQRGGTFIRFFADGYIWNNECLVYFDGIFSNASDDLLCLPESEHPQTPANRWLEVGFSKGGEDLSSGLLRCELSTYSSGHGGTAEYPSIIVQVNGRFDPVGLGGEHDFGFTATIDTFAQVTLERVSRDGDLSIQQSGNQIDVKLNQ